MSQLKCRCVQAPKPRDLDTPIVDQYAALITGLDLNAAHSRASKLLIERNAFGANDAAEAWLDAILTLLLQKGFLVPLDKLQNAEIDPPR